MTESQKSPILNILQIWVFACMLELNAFKVILASTSDTLSYAVFVIFAALVLGNIIICGEDVKVGLNVVLAMTLLVFFFAAGISLLFRPGGEAKLLKFAIGIIIALLATQTDDRVRMGAFKVAVLISTFYSLYLILRYSTVYNTIKFGRFNYLDVTLPVGLGLSFCLVLAFLSEEIGLRRFLYIAAAVVQFYALLQFPARGNVLFPIIILVLLLMMKYRVKITKLFLAVVISAVVLWISYVVFTRFSSSRLQARMLRLFGSASEESRLPLYRFYIRYILNDANWILGIGFCQSESVLANARFTVSYPHNCVLELVGEMGIIGLALVVAVTVKLFVCIRDRYNYLNRMHGRDRQSRFSLFFLTGAGFLFYLMSYMKSYSIYNGYQLFIFISMLCHFSAEERAVIDA